MALPTKEALIQVMHLSKQSLEGAESAAKGVEKMLSSTKLVGEEAKRQADAIKNCFNEFARNLVGSFAPTPSNWSGLAVTSVIQKVNLFQAAEALKNLGDVKSISLYYSINEQAQFMRAYAANDEHNKSSMQQLSPETTVHLDALFNSWLVLNNIQCKDGFLFKIDLLGKMLIDAEGKPLIADVSQLKQLLASEHSFKSFAAQKGIQIIMVEQ